jgi:hypothetical protein
MTEELKIDFRQEQESSLFFKTSILFLGPTTPSTNCWYTRLFIRYKAVKLTPYPNVVWRSTTSFHHMYAWRAE